MGSFRFGALRPFFTPFARAFGFKDLVAACANDGSGAGLIVNLQFESRAPAPASLRRLRLALPHITAAMRLRRALRAPDIVLDDGGIEC
jgi:hypothetical protein